MIKFDPNLVIKKPEYQAIIVFLAGLLLALLDKLATAIGLWESASNNAWIIMTAFVLFYALFNSILSLKADSMNRYWSRSIMSFVGLIAVSIGVSTLLSGIGIDEAGSFRWLFLVLTIGYLVFLVIVRLMRRIVEIAIKQDERLRGGE